jgi:4-amino-4-deoxy-L-arabinose transferase-like glycosyltransferase
MMLMRSRSGWPDALLPALAALALLWCCGLFGRGYWTPDEPREAALASSMIAQALPLPVLAGQRFAEKPPLTYWLAGASMRWFGVRPAAARAPQLCYAFLGCLAVLCLARRMLGAEPAARTAAWAATLVFATSALAYQVQIWLDTDALLLVGVCMALEGMYAALAADDVDPTARRQRLRGYLRMHLGLTLAFFAKNFAAWMVPVLAFLCFIAWERRWRELLRWEFYVGALLPLACIAAWVAAVAAQPDGAHSLRVLFWNNLYGRALPLAAPAGENYSSGHHNSPGKYLLELPLYLLPWTIVAAAALAAAWRGASAASTARAAWRFALCAAFPGLLLLSLAATARGIYAAPCMVGFALLIALWAAENPRARRPLSATAVTIMLLAAVVLAAAVALQWTVERASWPVFLLGALACAAVIGWNLRALRGVEQGAVREFAAGQLLRLAASWSLLLSLGTFGILAAVNRTQDTGALAARVAQSAAPSPMLLWNPDETTLAWAQLYLPAGSWSALDAGKDDSAAQLAQRLQSAPTTVVVSLLPGHGWSYAKWREYLRPHAVTTSLSMIPPSLAAREHALAAAGLSVTTRIERPGGRGYLLWRLR